MNAAALDEGPDTNWVITFVIPCLTPMEVQPNRNVAREHGQLTTAIRLYLVRSNEHLKPFVWSKRADEIQASVERFCHRIADSWHYGPQRMPNRSATLLLSLGTGGERVMRCRLTMRVVAKAIFGPT